MQWFKPSPKRMPCECVADVTEVSAVLGVRRGVAHPPFRFPLVVRAQRVRHYRVRDEAFFWHWSDQEVVKI